MGKELKDKRFSCALGFCLLPDGARTMYAGPHFYGKLTYEDAVKIQDLADQHAETPEFRAAMRPLVDALKQLGFLQAEAVAESRKKGDSPAQPRKPG